MQNQQRTEASRLYEFAQTLSFVERNILMLHYVEDLTATEVAAVLDAEPQEIAATLDDLKERARVELVVENDADVPVAISA